MDTLSLYQAGFKNVVASMGTSLTQEQARLVKRYADTVLISYDGDGAGQKANMRGLEILKGEGVNVKVVPLPDGLDPDDVIKQRGEEGYKKCLDSAMPLIDYKLTSLARGFDLTSTEDKRKYVAEAIKIIKTADSAAEQEELLKQLRDKTGITYESLSRDLQSAPAKAQPPPAKKAERKDGSNADVKASRFVIAAYLFGAKFCEADVSEIPFCHDVHGIIAKYLKSKKLMEERVQPAELFEFFDENTPEYEELCRILDYSDGEKLSGDVAEKYFTDCVLKLKLKAVSDGISALAAKIDAEQSLAERKKLTEKLQLLIKQKEKLKSGERQ